MGGIKLQDGGKHKKAEAKFKAAIEAHPTYAVALFNYGQFLYDQNKLKKALPYFRKALIETPLWPEVHYHLGQIYFDRRKWSDAVHHFRILTSLSPLDGSGWWLLASALVELGG